MFVVLVAPYCAIPRDYLSDTPLLRAMGFLVSKHGQLGAIPPPPFLSVSPLESMRSGGAIPPPLKRGISAIPARYPMKTRGNRCDTSLCDTISKRHCAIWGDISHWAAKFVVWVLVTLVFFYGCLHGMFLAWSDLGYSISVVLDCVCCSCYLFLMFCCLFRSQHQNKLSRKQW